MPSHQNKADAELRRLAKQSSIAGKDWPGASGNDAELRRLSKQAEYPGILAQPTHERASSYYDEIGRYVGQTDSTGRGHLPGAGIQDKVLRFNLSTADNLKEKQKELQRVYPDGKIIQVPTSKGTKEVYWTEKTGWDIVDQDLSVDPSLNKGGGFLGDAADVAGSMWEIAPEIAAAIASRGGTLAAAAGAGAGRLLKEGYQKIRDTNDQDAWDVAKDVAISMAASAGGNLLAKALAAPINAVRGASMSGAVDAQKVLLIKRAEELGLEPMMVYQVANSPLLQRMGAQSASVNKFLGMIAKKQSDDAYKYLAKMRQAARSGQPLDNITDELFEGQSRLVADATDQLRGGVGLKQAGDDMKAGFDDFDARQAADVDAKYAAARDVESPDFDIADLQDTAQGLKAGDVAKGAPAAGATTAKDVRVSGDLETELSKAVDDILNMERTVSDYNGTSSMDQLADLAKRVGPLTQPPPGVRPGIHEANAKKLYAAIRAIQENPENADELFQGLWDTARTAAKARFERLDRPTLQGMLKNDRPAALAHEIFTRKVAIDDLLVIKSNLSPGDWGNFKSAAKQFYAERPDKIARFLEETDPESLKVLFSPDEIKILRNTGLEMSRIQSVGLQDAFESQTRKYAFVNQLIDTNKTGAIEKLNKMAPVGSSARKDIRAALLDRIGKISLGITPEGQRMLNPNMMLFELQKLTDLGFNKFLTSKDVMIVKDLARYLQTAYQGSDTGASILGAELASQTQQAFNPINIAKSGGILRATGVFIRLQEMKLFGRMMASPKARRIFLGKGKEPINFTWLKTLGSVAGTVTKDITRNDAWDLPYDKDDE